MLLASLGTTARPAIPELIRVLREDDDLGVRTAATWALGNIANREDKPVIEALVAAVTKETNGSGWRMAGGVLWGFDPEAAAKAGYPPARRQPGTPRL
jgi:hypothetical protein